MQYKRLGLKWLFKGNAPNKINNHEQIFLISIYYFSVFAALVGVLTMIVNFGKLLFY